MVSADFSRTCKGCGYIVEEPGGKYICARCNAPGPRKGYTMSERGRFFPYIPAWCPLMDRGSGEGKANDYRSNRR